MTGPHPGPPGFVGMGYILKRWDGGGTLVAWATNGGRPQAVAADGVDHRGSALRFAQS